ncbi:MAG: hypothetical protein ACFFDI_16140 [Promethearchaeota archaeon]
MALELIPLLMILGNILGLVLTYLTSAFFIKRIFDKKLHADILVCVISFILGCFFLFNTVNYLLLANIVEVPLSSQFVMIVLIIISSLGIILLGLMLKTAFRPMSENATAFTYLLTFFSGASLGGLVLILNTTVIRWENGPVLIYDGTSFLPILFLAVFTAGLLLSGLWFFYEMVNANRYLRRRLREANRRSSDLLRLNLLSIAALSFPFILLLPLLPNQFPVLNQRILALILIPVFGLTWSLGWIMPKFLRSRYS